MKIACPYCNAANENPEIVNGMIQCQSCHQWFAGPLDIQAARGKDLESHCEKIRRNANILIAISALFAVIGTFTFFAGISTSISGENASGEFITSGSLVGIALWLYLIGQVVHIRANTEK